MGLDVTEKIDYTKIKTEIEVLIKEMVALNKKIKTGTATKDEIIGFRLKEKRLNELKNRFSSKTKHVIKPFENKITKKTTKRRTTELKNYLKH
jgi:hypothetical protein